MPDLPEEAGFVAELAEAFRARRRAIKHRGAKLDWTRSSESVANAQPPVARLDVDCDYGRPQSKLRIIVWDDRWMWVDARCGSKKGWVWAVTLEGRFLAAKGAKPLVALLEQTLDAIGSANNIEAAIAALWSPHLAQGPREI
jgi:hypothetical protein